MLQLEMLRTSLMLSQQFMESFVAMQKQIETVARASAPSPDTGAKPSPVSGVEELTRFLVVKPNGCIGAADLKS